MSKLRLIGDVHAPLEEYIKLASGADYSIQVGDLGFNYVGIEALDPTRHRVLAGNHDNYFTTDDGKCFDNQTAHFLGDYGTLQLPDCPSIFYVRGGRSIDRHNRTDGVDWFPHEELSYRQLSEAIFAYSQAKPEVVISHECPAFLVNEVVRENRGMRQSTTAHALEAMWTNHQPKAWFFGHFHHDWSISFRGTYFRCLDIRTTYDVPMPFKAEEMESTATMNSLELWRKPV